MHQISVKRSLRAHQNGVKMVVSTTGKNMAKQDDYVRVTLRLPPELHEALSKEAGAKSLNAEIVLRLNNSLAERDEITNTFSKLYSPLLGDIDKDETDEFSRWFVDKLLKSTQESVKSIAKEAGSLLKNGKKWR